NLLNRYQQAVETQETRRSPDMATGIARSINDEGVLTSPETNLNVLTSALEEVTPQLCHERLREFWDSKGLKLILTTKHEPENARAELVSRFEASRETPVAPPVESELKAFAYTNFGTPGEITSMEEISDLEITQLTFANGLRVNLKPTDFQQNRILVQARIGSGQLTQPEDHPGLSEFATAVIEGGGIGEHSADDLRKLFAGRNVSFGFSVAEDHFSLSGQTTPEDFELQLQAMTAQLLHPGYRTEAISQFRKAVPMIFQQLKHTSAGPMQRMSAWLRGNDSRFAFPESPEPLLSYELSDIQPWLEQEFTQGAIELNVVGDFDLELVLPAIQSTFGALPTCPDSTEIDSELRQVDFPGVPAEKTYEYESKIAQGDAIVIWKTLGLRGNQREFRRLNLVADILGDRLREEIREKLGASYSPYAGVNGSTALDDFGYLITATTASPENIPELAKVCLGLGEKFAQEGATADELERARKPLLADLEKSLRDNGYWLGSVMSGSFDNPNKLELCRNRLADLTSISLDEINELAARVLVPENAIEVKIAASPPAEN
ncbi:MAG: M16 family metallopeptidase, partial [Verrucomicrobiales bacterium]